MLEPTHATHTNFSTSYQFSATAATNICDATAILTTIPPTKFTRDTVATPTRRNNKHHDNNAHLTSSKYRQPNPT